MANLSPLKLNNRTSFHTVALNIVYVAILTICHFVIPYIHELVFSFFNGLFLILSIVLFFYLNAMLRTSSVSRLAYFSLFCRIIISILFFSLSIIFIAFITNTTEIIKRAEFLTFLIYLFSFSVLAMVLTKYLYLLIKPKEQSNIILLTDHEDKLSFNNNYLGLQSKTFIKYFHINDLEEMIDFAVNKGVEGVYISISAKNLNSLETFISDLSIYAFSLYWVLPESFFDKNAGSSSIKPVLLNGSPVSLDSNQYFLKRTLDVAGSTFILIILSPLIFLVGCLIKFSDSGPIFYHQSRHGQYGKEFNMLKFRSMAVGSDYSDLQVTHDDPRVTLIGKILRKTSFDEIPQLLNILRGEMSLVGPRPHIITETDKYSKKIIRFLTRHQVKPGLTGLAQIRTRGKTNSLELMREKLDSDLEYINQWSIYMDIKILLITPLSIWKNRNTNV
jgi:exopolysaccharide biosynthesis polyprenyl glycosylphosphotransferase